MGNKGINYIELLRAIKKHWEPVFQDKVFWSGMLRWVIGSIVLLSIFAGVFSLDPTRKELERLINDIQSPPGAILVERGGFRGGISIYYKFPGMSDEEVRAYYKKELIRKKWRFFKRDTDGDYVFHNGKIVFRLQKTKVVKEKIDYDWIITIAENKTL